MTLKELNDNFMYVSDVIKHKRIEHWSVMKPDEFGVYMGDCEDYAITVKHKVRVERNHTLHKWDYYWCRLSGVGHCVLSDGAYVIDNNIKQVIPKSQYFRIFDVTEFRKFTWFELFGKWVTSRIVNPILKLIKV